MSKNEFKLPDIGEGVAEGEVVSWLVKAGDVVEADQDLVEVMTDKATVTIGAPARARVLEILAKEGDVVPVGSVLVVLGSLDGEGAASGGGDAPLASAPKSVAGEPAPEAARGAAVATAVGDIRETLPGTSLPARSPAVEGYFNERPLAAPATRKAARELGVDLRRVAPSGEHGRVSREDVEAFARGGAGKSALTTARAPSGATPAVSSSAPKLEKVEPVAREERVPIRGLRKRIYENMARSKRTAAHFTYVEECECSRLVEMRTRLKPAAEKAGVSLSYLPFVVKAVVAALRRHPELNAVVDDSTMEIVRRSTFDIGMAAATEAGLIVPVLRNVDELGLLDIAREIERLGKDARAGKLAREDLGGSSFTITSLGKLGGILATPVVNYPEVAILFVSEMKKKPVVKGDEIVIGQLMNVALSFDHRIIDGHVGAAFAKDVVEMLEEPERLLLEM